MDVKSVLAELGLSDGEIDVYLALLKLGSSPVSKIKEDTQLHRTTIYDFVEKLLNKGLINYVIKNNVKYYNAADPEKLLDYLKEKQDHLQQMIPELQKLVKFQKDDVKVEVYKGKEGLKTAILECTRIGKEVVGFGVDEKYWKKELPIFIEQYQRILKENNMQERIITKVNPEYLFDQSNTKYKFISSDFFSPTSTLIYGSKIQITLWEPSLTTLVIENNTLANAYRKHFENLWNQESQIFHGIDEVKSIFSSCMAGLDKDQEYLVFGIPHTADPLYDFFDKIMEDNENRGLKSRLIFDERAKEQIKVTKKYSLTCFKALSPEFFSPAEVNIFGDKVVIIIWTRDPQAFVIDNKDVARSFKVYFDLLWKTAKDI